MLKLFLADLKQLKRTFLFLVLIIPLLHVLDDALYPLALPTEVTFRTDDSVFRANEWFSAYSGWLFAMMASIILLLFSVESGAQGRLPTLLSLPLSRWQVAVLRYLPPLTLIPALGLILSFYRFVLGFFVAMRGTDLWYQQHTTDWNNIKACIIWSFHRMTNIFGAGHASIPFQLLGWISIGLLISAIPLLIDDIWPGVKRSSFTLWLSVSLFAGIALQVAVLLLGKSFDLQLIPHITWPHEASLSAFLQPTLLGIELTLALSLLGLELWCFQRRASYV